MIKDGKKKTEPVYEYGRNRPSVKISATAGLRLEVRAAGGKAMADETARHTIQEEYLLDAGPPSRDEIEDQLIDRIVQKGAGRVSPGRQPVRVLLARSDEVDGLNSLAQNRRWDEWLKALKSVPIPSRSGGARLISGAAISPSRVDNSPMKPTTTTTQGRSGSRLDADCGDGHGEREGIVRRRKPPNRISTKPRRAPHRLRRSFPVVQLSPRQRAARAAAAPRQQQRQPRSRVQRPQNPPTTPIERCRRRT